MTFGVLASVLLAGFALGLVHAFDPDHVMTIASLSAREDARSATLRFAALWALGHGGLLVGIAALALVLGWTLPAALPSGAERAVGLVLIATGAAALWSRHPPHGAGARLRQSAPFAVGLVHGLAGSAAMLAMVPVTLVAPLAGLAYALVFSLGVLAAMMGFGMVLDRAQGRLADRAPGLRRGLRLALGAGALGLGVHWLAA